MKRSMVPFPRPSLRHLSKACIFITFLVTLPVKFVFLLTEALKLVHNIQVVRVYTLTWLNVAETSSKYAVLDRDEEAESRYFTCANHTFNTRDKTRVKVRIITDETRSNEGPAEETHVIYRQVDKRHADEHDLNDTQVKKADGLHRVSSIIMAKSCLPLKELIHADSHTLSEEIDKTEETRFLQQSELEKLKRLKESRENIEKINDEKIRLLREMRATELILTSQQKELDGRHSF